MLLSGEAGLFSPFRADMPVISSYHLWPAKGELDLEWTPEYILNNIKIQKILEV
jgi:hypothetical protein